MMQQRPLAIVILAILHFAAPVGNFFLNARMNGLSVRSYAEIYFQAQNFLRVAPNLVVPILAGVCILACRTWSFYLYIALMFLLTLLNFLKIQQLPTDGRLGPLVSVVLVNIILVGYFINPRMRMYYLDPAMRFWETKPRFRIVIAAVADRPPQEFKVTITNISESGVFLTSANKLPEEGLIRIRFDYLDQHYVFIGEIVRSDRVAKGIGIRLVHNRVSKRRARQLVWSLINKNVTVETRQKSSYEQFKRWLKFRKEADSTKRPEL